MSKTKIVGCFFAEVVEADGGPTGELVFVDKVQIVDSGGNRLIHSGAYSSPKNAARRLKSLRGNYRLRPVPGTIHRINGHEPSTHPDYFSIQVGSVAESEIN